ncbi:MAG: type II 3-dehydroquinate dehydratase [Cyanobacteria bacterium SIG30]|nr:type II 3-dehydroquinate dehydratase [Cyanobacteria bacterium SIG30]
MKILVINGPNLNMLGIREPEIYGSLTLNDIQEKLLEFSKDFEDIELEFYQSNHEGDIVDKIQESYEKISGIIINPAAYTHTSIAIADAISAVNIPTVEVHLSDINEREEFRKQSYIAPKCIAQVKGLGYKSYFEGLSILHNYLKK